MVTCPYCGAPMIGESRRPDEPPDQEDLRCEAGCDDGPLLAGGRTRAQAEEDEETGAMDWLADALADHAAANPGTVFYADEG